MTRKTFTFNFPPAPVAVFDMQLYIVLKAIYVNEYSVMVLFYSTHFMIFLTRLSRGCSTHPISQGTFESKINNNHINI